MYMAGKILLILLLAPWWASAQFKSDTTNFGVVNKVLDTAGSTMHYLLHATLAARDFDYTFNTFKCRTPVGNILPDRDTTVELMETRKIAKHGDRISICSLLNTGDCYQFDVDYLGCTEVSGERVLVYITRIAAKSPEKPRLFYVNPMVATLTIDNETFYY